MGLWKTVLVAAVAAGVGFAAGRATSSKESGSERVDLRESKDRIDSRSNDTTIDRVAFAAPDVGTVAGEGKTAADGFCRANGFANAGDFTCTAGGSSCKSFDLIVCEGKAR